MSVLQSQAEDDERKPFTELDLAVSSSAVVSDAEAVQLLMKAKPSSTDLNTFALDTTSEGGAPSALVATANADTSPSANVGDIDGAMIEVATPHFTDFQFSSYQGLTDDGGAIVALPEVSTVDLFGPAGSLSPSSSPTRMEAQPNGHIDDVAVAPTDAGAGGMEETASAQGEGHGKANPEGAASTKTKALGSKTSTEKDASALLLPVFEDGLSSRMRRPSLEAAVSDDGSQDSNGHGGGTSLLDEPVSDEFGLVLNGPVNSIELVGGGSIGGHRQSFLGKDDKSGVEVAPPWSELKTKAGKERKRLPLACIACRRKKIRCSGEKPACKHCLRSRTPCVYKVTARKAAPRTDYMAMLDKRLKRMEDRIIKIVPKADQDATVTSSVTRAIVKPAIPGTLASGSTNGNGAAAVGAAGSRASANKKRAADEAFGPELDHWARIGSKNRLGSSTRPHNILLQQESEENELLQEGAEALPSRELQEHLAEVFFENIYGQAYHLLHKPSYMRKLRAGALPPVLVLSVCAVSARFSSHPKLANVANFLRGEEWASHARDIVTRRYEWPNITILTCLLILGLHEFGTCHGGRSWALGGQAIRMAFALQLHKDLERDPLPSPGGAPLSFIDREIRRRTMWACFLMDRFNSSGTDRPTFIKEESIKIQLPIKEKFFQLDMPGPTENLAGHPVTPPALGPVELDDDGHFPDAKENMGVAAYMIRAIAVWGRVINYLNQGGKELDPHPMWSPESGYTKLVKQADEMMSNLPPSLTFSPENLHLHDTEGMANQFLFLHIAIQQNILFMNRFAISSPNGNAQQDSVPKAFVTKAGAKAFAAANRISDLLRDAESYLIAAPFVGYCAFLSSTVHIFGIFSGNPTMEATSKRNLATNVKFLSKMKRYWGMFHFMAENLREQYRQCADAARQGTPANENAVAASPIFQYGDWFDRYPHGVSNSDFGDPATYKKKEKGDDAVLEQKPELHTMEEFFTTVTPQKVDGSGGAVNGGNNNVHGNRDVAATGRPATQAKRKSIAKKSGSVASSRGTDHPPIEPLLTDLSAANPDALQQHQQHAHPSQQHPQAHGIHHRRHYSTSLGGQSSGPTSFNPLSLPQSQAAAAAAAAASFHAATMSPISPVAVGPFAHPHHHHHQQQQAQQQQAFYSPDLLALSLAQQTNGILPQLDRQLVFNAYGGSLDAAAAAAVNGGPSLDGIPWDGPGSGNGNAGPRGGQAAAAGGGDASVASAADALHAFGHGHEPSSAWFMPFNMDPPEIGQDLSSMSGLDQFANIFGSNGMASGGGGGGLGGLHHGN